MQARQYYEKRQAFRFVLLTSSPLPKFRLKSLKSSTIKITFAIKHALNLLNGKSYNDLSE